METEFDDISVKRYDDNNDITDNSQGNQKEQRYNDNVKTENNIPHHSKTTINLS